jgi:hypothetical protein
MTAAMMLRTEEALMPEEKTEGVIPLSGFRPNMLPDMDAIQMCRQHIDLRIKQFGEENAWRWIEIGERLSDLKKFLSKPGPADKTERIGWKEAFRHDPKPCPWARENADKLIKVHEFFGGGPKDPPSHKLVYNSLPMAWKALYVIATTMTHEQLVEHVKAKRITPISTEAEVRKLVRPKTSAKKRKAMEPKERQLEEVGHRIAENLIKRYTIGELAAVVKELMEYVNAAKSKASGSQKEES